MEGDPDRTTPYRGFLEEDPDRTTPHRGFVEEGPHRTGPDWVSRPVSCFLKNVFFVDFNLAHNEAPERDGREELLLESQEGQELSAGANARQLVLNMSSEDQTVDHTYMLMGNDHDTIFIDFSEFAGQEDTNFENSTQKANDCGQTSY